MPINQLLAVVAEGRVVGCKKWMILKKIVSI